MKVAFSFTALLLVAAIVFGVMNYQDGKNQKSLIESLKLENAGLRAKFEGGNLEQVKELQAKLDEVELRTAQREKRLREDIDHRISSEIAGARSALEREQEQQKELSERFETIKETTPLRLTKREREIQNTAAIAKVLSVQASLGFVTINAGSANNISRGAKFAVRRGTDIVGLLVVRDTRTMGLNECPADIVRGSVEPGMAIEPGDEVIQRPVWMDSTVQR